MNKRVNGKIFVFSAPSGAGKTTLLNHLKNDVEGLVYSISATTRAPRPGEISGKHYFFFSEDEFKKRIANDEFAEWAIVHGNYYGTPRYFIDSTVKSCSHIIMDIDVYGKLQFDRAYPEAIGVLILPPSMNELEKRLRGRASDNEATIALRIKNATEELKLARSRGKYEHVIINDDFGRALTELEELVRSSIAIEE